MIKNKNSRRAKLQPRATAIPIHWSGEGFRVPLNLPVRPQQFWLQFLAALRQLTDKTG